MLLQFAKYGKQGYMKRSICIVIAVLAVLSVLVGCSKKNDVEVDAILDYYVTRMSYDVESKDIKFVEEDSKTGNREYTVTYMDGDKKVETVIYISVYGQAYTLYDEDGTRLHIYNGINSQKEE